MQLNLRLWFAAGHNSCSKQSCFSLSKAIQTPQRTCLSLGRLAQLTILKANREYILSKQFRGKDGTPAKTFNFKLSWEELGARGMFKAGLPTLLMPSL